MRANVANPVFKLAQLGDLLSDVGDSRVGHPHEISTLVRPLPHGEEVASLLDAEAEISQPPDEQKLARLVIGVAPLPSLRALGLRHQTDPFIVPDRIDTAAGQTSKLSDP